MATQPVRIEPELLEAAKRAAAASGRSAAQQIAHWVRIGRELDSSFSIPVGHALRISAAAYDQLPPEAQAVVRAEWDAQIDDRLASLDLSARFAGRDYVVAGDASGSARKVKPSPPPTPNTRSRAKAAKKSPRRAAARG